ncbi:type VI secretion system baseplate subunit TssF [Paraburkholderia phosphatilytica]|uniref:type VI secretion system baseplate subunit TssF n=1 Tax=Paraburkholderia phosphatilytica TaxID=2282883 RepID=UPI000E4FFCB6|nr:type VI secretion system baseplate subunit TssF [Paraburkholderia phosphatilytica]
MDEFESLLPFYERELAHLRRAMLAFEKDRPKTAGRLSISGGRSDDPQVERMLQSAALTNARAAARVDDQYPEFTEALIESTFPLYLRPFPSCSIAQFDVGGMFDGLTQAVVLPRGTELEHRPSLCGFSTAWDTTLAPLKVARAQFSLPTSAPALEGRPLPQATVGIISIELTSRGLGFTRGGSLYPTTLRTYVHADRLLTAALLDAILLRPQPAFVEADRSRRWIPLPETPAHAVGFDDDQALVPDTSAGRQRALRMLLEFAAFPNKFNFFDIDFDAMLAKTGPCETLTLHVPVTPQTTGDQAAQRLRVLSADHLRLFCTPVVNLFKSAARPADVKAGVHRYAVALPDGKASRTEIHSIDRVRMIHGEDGDSPGEEIPPHRGLQHWSSIGAFWMRERDRLAARSDTGSESAIALVDLDEKPFVPEASKLLIDLTCSNGDIPSGLVPGAPDGDLHSEEQNLGGPVTMLVRPSQGVRFSVEEKSPWQLVQAFAPGHESLPGSGRRDLQNLLLLFSRSVSADATRYITGIVGMTCRAIRPQMVLEHVPMPLLVPGIEVRLTVDEAFFAGVSLHTFALLMEQYFLRFAGRDCLQLIVETDAGAEIFMGAPRMGQRSFGGF